MKLINTTFVQLLRPGKFEILAATSIGLVVFAAYPSQGREAIAPLAKCGGVLNETNYNKFVAVGYRLGGNTPANLSLASSFSIPAGSAPAPSVINLSSSQFDLSSGGKIAQWTVFGNIPFSSCVETTDPPVEISLRIGSSGTGAGGTIGFPIIGSGGLEINLPGGVLEMSANNTYTGVTKVFNGELRLSGSLKSGLLEIAQPGKLSGTGLIQGSVFNFGTVAPGTTGTIGTLTIANGNFSQDGTGVLEIDVNGTDSDLLKLTGTGVVSNLGGAVKISGTPTPGLVYTGIRGEVAYSGKAQANADVSSVVVASAYKFCRSSDPCFKNLNGSPSLDLKQLQFDLH